MYGCTGFTIEFHKYNDIINAGELIADICTVYLPSLLNKSERGLVSKLYEFGLKVIWNEQDINEMLNFNEPFDPGDGRYFLKRLHDQGRLWYAIIELQPDFIDRVNVGYGSKFYRPYISGNDNSKIVIGNGTYISNNARFFLDEDFCIGNFCQVSTDFTAITRRHAITNLSLGCITGGGLGFFGETEDMSKSITIKNDVWIGTKVILMPGVTVENGCVIGAGSVVTKDCKPYGIYAGNPAKLIRYRFSEDKISILLKAQWWNWPLRKIWKEKDVFISKVSSIDSNSMSKMIGL
jgi:acetyltransferase-like isoleucine patch superfamily enzyme